jgi:RNA polymerase sigma factor (sigma-70 family)
VSDTSLDDWFEAEVLPHEGVLTRYLQRVWVNQVEVPDLRQEIYVRVYESAARGRPGSPRAFLLATAKHLIVDRVRRERIVSIDYTQDFESLNVLTDELTPEQRLSARQELRRLSDALDGLSEDCRAVVWLRRVEGLSQKEVAAQLGLQEGTVASHLCRGLQTLTKVVLGDDEGRGDVKRSENERGQGGRNHEE